jgi:hypothetical protein
MTEFVHLIGADEVSRAAYTMRDAAHEMKSAAGTIDEALRHHRQFMDDWLARFEQIVLAKENQ